MAQRVAADFQAVRHCDALIEDEAFAFPAAVRSGHLFEIFQDAALEVIYLVQAFSLEEGSRLFAADAAGTEHRDFRRRSELVAVLAEPGGEIAEAVRFRIDRA